MRVLNLLAVALAALAPVLAKGSKPPDKNKSLGPSKDAAAGKGSFSLATPAEGPHDVDDTSSESGDSSSSELSTPLALAPRDAAGLASFSAERASNDSVHFRPGQMPHDASSPALSSLTSLSQLSRGSMRRSASASPPPSKAVINPLDLDDPPYRAPSPDTPERVGRRQLALNAPPEDKIFYSRPKFAKDRRSNLDIDRRLDRTFHPYFIFDSEARRKRHNEILQEIKRLLLDLELSTNAHFALYEGRPEKNPAQPDELAHVVSSRTIDANPEYRALVERFLRQFERMIATPRRAEHAALLELAQRELEAQQRWKRAQEARAKAAAAVHQSAHLLRERQRAKLITSAKPHTRSAARRESPADDAAAPATVPDQTRSRPAQRAARAAGLARGPAPARARTASAREPGPALAPATGLEAAAPAPVVVPHAAYVGTVREPAPGADEARTPVAHPGSSGESDEEFEIVLEWCTDDDEFVERQMPKKKANKGKGKAPAPAQDFAREQSIGSSSVVPDSEPERQYEAARLLSLRTQAEHERARAQPGASTSRTTLEESAAAAAAPSTPRCPPTEPPATPATIRAHGALTVPERAEPDGQTIDVEDQLPAEVRALLRGVLGRPYWLAIEHVWRTYPPRDYLDGISDLNARFELDLHISFIFKLMTLLSRNAPPAPL